MGAAWPMAVTGSANANAVSTAMPRSFPEPRTLTVMMSVPRASNCLRNSAVATSPVEIIAIIEAMPIKIPMKPGRLRAKPRAASRRLSATARLVRFIAPPP